MHKIFIPYDWGDEALHDKNVYFKKHKSEFNTAFVGGSLTYRHIDVTKFDSISTEHGIVTHSFNLAVDGNNHIKQMILINRLLNDKNSNLKYLFFALSSDAYFEDRNLHTKKFVTWVDLPSMLYAINVSMHSDAPLRERLKISYQYVLTWVENQVNAGMGLHLLYYINNSRHPIKESQAIYNLGKNYDGFSPYGFEEGVDSASLSYEDQLLYWSNSHFKRHPDQMDSITQTYKDDFTEFVPGKGHVNKAMLNCYLKIIKKAEKKGIKLIVLLPAKSRLRYSMFLPLYELLPEGNKMSMGNIFKYPEFYMYSNTFNFYHMNAKGASLYTEAVAQEFLKLNGIEADFYKGDTTAIKIDSISLK